MRHKLKNFGLNTRSFVYAVAIHLMVGVLLFASFNWETVVVATPQPKGPEPVKAAVVSEDEIQQQMDAIREQEEKKKEEELQAKQRLEEMERQAEQAEEKRKQEQQRLAELEKQKAAREKAELEAKKRREEELRIAKAKEAEERKRQAEEAERKKREEQAKQAAEEKRRQELAEQKRKEQELAEKKRKEQELAERRRKEQELAEQRKREQELAEKRRREAELQARLEEERVQRLVDDARARYTPIIQQKVSRNWSRPPGAQVGLSAWVRVRLTPSGEVISAQVIRSSGNPIFDRSVENAVLKASPLPIPQEQVLNDRFREIQFNFNPDEKLVSKS